MAKHTVLTYLHFRILEFPLMVVLMKYPIIIMFVFVVKTMPFLPPMTGNGKLPPIKMVMTPMTGNGNHTTYKNGDFPGGWWVYGIVVSTLYPNCVIIVISMNFTQDTARFRIQIPQALGAATIWFQAAGIRRSSRAVFWGFSLGFFNEDPRI